MPQMRYRFYQCHKFLSYVLTELERLIAKVDFRNESEVHAIRMQMEALDHLMQSHAAYEDQMLHELLRKKGSRLHENVEAHHQTLENDLKKLRNELEGIERCDSPELRLSQGYQLFLSYRLFISDQYKHFHDEETTLMSEFQQLYNDSDLRRVEFNSYAHMLPSDMLHMAQDLFPHMNPIEHELFVNDMKECEPEKFSKIAESCYALYRKEKLSKT